MLCSGARCWLLDVADHRTLVGLSLKMRFEALDPESIRALTVVSVEEICGAGEEVSQATSPFLERQTERRPSPKGFRRLTLR
jgi:hypothetical protein